MIGGAIRVECERWQKSRDYTESRSRRSASSAFKVGMADRVSSRLQDMARALEPTATSASGTALVVVKGRAVDDAFARLGLRLGKASGGASIRDGGAYASGKSAGDRVNLSRPVGQSGARRIA